MSPDPQLSQNGPFGPQRMTTVPQNLSFASVMTRSIMCRLNWKFQVFNILWPADAMWRQRCWSALLHVMACCLKGPRHYMKQCWLTINEVLWHSFVGNIDLNIEVPKLCLKFTLLKSQPHLPWDSELYVSHRVAEILVYAKQGLSQWEKTGLMPHDDIMIWKRFPHYCPFVRRIHRSPLDSLTKCQWFSVWSPLCC